MSSNRFSLYDFFVDIIPGAIALLILLSLLSGHYDIIGIISQTSFLPEIVFLILSYFAGHLIQAVVSPVDTWFTKREPYIARDAGLPKPFEHRIEQADKKTGPSVDKEVAEGLNDFFDSGLSGHDQFFATQSYLWNNNIGRIQRFQRLYTLFRGLYMPLFIGGILHWVTIIPIIPSIWNPYELVIIGFVLIILAAITYWRRVSFHEDMVKSMFFDFYANVISDSDSYEK